MKREAPEGAHRITIRVLYADTDKMGVVYHAGYLRFCEAARAELMRHVGLPYRELEATGRMLPVIEAHLRFVAPARYDEIIEVAAWVEELSGASITFHYLIERDHALLVEATTRHTCLDRTNHVVRLPDELRHLAKKKTVKPPARQGAGREES